MVKNFFLNKLMKELMHVSGGLKSLTQLKSHLMLLARVSNVNNLQGKLIIKLTEKAVRETTRFACDEIACYALSKCLTRLSELSDCYGLPAFGSQPRVWSIACEIVKHGGVLLEKQQLGELLDLVQTLFNMDAYEVSALECAYTLAEVEHICLCCIDGSDVALKTLIAFSQLPDKIHGMYKVDGSPCYISKNNKIYNNTTEIVFNGIVCECNLKIKHKNRIIVDNVTSHKLCENHAWLESIGAKAKLNTRIEVKNKIKANYMLEDLSRSRRNLSAVYEVKFFQSGKIDRRKLDIINLDDGLIVTDNCDFNYVVQCNEFFNISWNNDSCSAVLVFEVPLKNNLQWSVMQFCTDILQDAVAEIANGRRIGYFALNCQKPEKAVYETISVIESKTGLVQNLPLLLPTSETKGEDVTKQGVSTRLLSDCTTITYCGGQLTKPHGELVWLRYADRLTAINTSLSQMEKTENGLKYYYRDSLIEASLEILDGENKFWKLNVKPFSKFVKDVNAFFEFSFASRQQISVSENRSSVCLNNATLHCCSVSDVKVSDRSLKLVFKNVENRQTEICLSGKQNIRSGADGTLSLLNSSLVHGLYNNLTLPNCLSATALCYTHPLFACAYADRIFQQKAVTVADEFGQNIKFALDCYTLPLLLVTSCLLSGKELSTEQHNIISGACNTPHNGTFELIIRCAVVGKYINMSDSKLYLVALNKKLREEICSKNSPEWRAFAILVGVLDEKPQTVEELNNLWAIVENQMPQNWYYVSLLELLYGLSFSGGGFSLSAGFRGDLPSLKLLLGNKTVSLNVKSSGKKQLKLNGSLIMGNVPLNALKLENEISVEY